MLLFSGCEEETAPTQTLESKEAPIIGGSNEYGWKGVGALALSSGWGYQGAFCTGTLVTSQWVLTAAHCLTSSQGITISPSTVKFYVGTDATPDGWSGTPSSGTLYSVDTFKIHPGYDPDSITNVHDIGLMHLSQPVPNVDPLQVNYQPLEGKEGQSVLYVGFGVTDHYDGSGSGIKRSTHMSIVDLWSRTYSSKFSGSGICSGDSGGPGILEGGSQPLVIGVNSSVQAISSSGDPCNGMTTHTRTDHYATWITGIIGGTAPSCQTNPNICECDGVCQAGGTCDNSSCRGNDCDDILSCFNSCNDYDSSCVSGCYGNASDRGVELFDQMEICIYGKCDNYSGSAFQDCVYSKCADEVAECMPSSVEGDQDCATIFQCTGSCAAGDWDCWDQCYYDGTGMARIELMNIRRCEEEYCADNEDPGCVSFYCVDEIHACSPRPACDLTGGDCGQLGACNPAAGGVTYCRGSNGKTLNQVCTPGGKVNDCGDGLICQPSGSSSVCRQMCLDDTPCQGGLGYCKIPAFSALPELGTCFCEGDDCATCQDKDNDGFCAPEDCVDTDPTIHPGGKEWCDNLDNDCDGVVDDNCGQGSDDPDVTTTQDTLEPEDDVTQVDGDEPPGSKTTCTASAGPGSPAQLLLFLALALALPLLRRRRA